MALQQITVPHLATYSFGVGVDRLSGTAMNLAVNPTPQPPVVSGANQGFEVSRISSTSDLQEKLGIDVDASYGCAAFGTGISARFSFARESDVHSASLFLAVTADVHLADLSIAECTLTAAASSVVDRPDIFSGTYGDMFARACRTGGFFVGLIRVETFDDAEATSIEAQLHGSYGAFDATATGKFKEITTEHNVNVYCKLYAEGGPPLQLSDPGDPALLLQAANTWMAAMQADPTQYARPYEWTLAPLSIAEGPLPLNQAQIEGAQDVLKFCADQRVALDDQLNLLTWWIQHPDRYDWSGAPNLLQEATQAASGTQIDLDTVTQCASAAMDDPATALMPAAYAAGKGIAYPAGQMPTALPKPFPGPAMIFDQTNFAGHSQILRIGSYDNALGQITVGNDAIRSLQVPPGLVVRLYQHFHFQGEFIDIREDTADLNTWDASTSSLIVYSATDTPPRTTIVVLNQLPNNDNWDGPFWIFSASDGMQSEPDMVIRSALIPDGMVVTFYSGPDYTGARRDYTQDTLDVGDNEPGQYSFIVWDAQQGMPPH
jgi:hypothetical protein